MAGVKGCSSRAACGRGESARAAVGRSGGPSVRPSLLRPRPVALAARARVAASGPAAAAAPRRTPASGRGVGRGRRRGGRAAVSRRGRAEPGAWSGLEARARVSSGPGGRSGARAPVARETRRLPRLFFFRTCARTVSGGDARSAAAADRSVGRSVGERPRQGVARSGPGPPARAGRRRKGRQLLAVDHSARASMKNAASCEN